MTFSPAIFDRHVLALGLVGRVQALVERSNTISLRIRRGAAEHPDHRQR
jgi:hypothetical protein